MKLKGQKIPDCFEVVPIIRGSDEFFIQIAPVLNYDEFNNFVPKPTPTKMILKPGNITEPDLTDTAYKEALDLYGRMRWAWMIIKSLAATPELTWDEVDLTKPDTWLKVDDELAKANFTTAELNAIYEGVATVHGLNEDKVQAARESFFRTLQQA